MFDMPIWTFWSLNVLAIIAVIFLRKKNERHLSAEEVKEKSKIVREENSLKRWQNWTFLAASVALVAANRIFEADVPIKFFFYLIIAHLTYTAFRNRQAFRRIHLPESYISREFSLGMMMILLLAFDIFYVF